MDSDEERQIYDLFGGETEYNNWQPADKGEPAPDGKESPRASNEPQERAQNGKTCTLSPDEIRHEVDKHVNTFDKTDDVSELEAATVLMDKSYLSDIDVDDDGEAHQTKSRASTQKQKKPKAEQPALETTEGSAEVSDHTDPDLGSDEKDPQALEALKGKPASSDVDAEVPETPVTLRKRSVEGSDTNVGKGLGKGNQGTGSKRVDPARYHAGSVFTHKEVAFKKKQTKSAQGRKKQRMEASRNAQKPPSKSKANLTDDSDEESDGELSDDDVGGANKGGNGVNKAVDQYHAGLAFDLPQEVSFKGTTEKGQSEIEKVEVKRQPGERPFFTVSGYTVLEGHVRDDSGRKHCFSAFIIKVMHDFGEGEEKKKQKAGIRLGSWFARKWSVFWNELHVGKGLTIFEFEGGEVTADDLRDGAVAAVIGAWDSGFAEHFRQALERRKIARDDKKERKGVSSRATLYTLTKQFAEMKQELARLRK